MSSSEWLRGKARGLQIQGLKTLCAFLGGIRFFVIFLVGTLLFGLIYACHLSILPLTLTKSAGLSNRRLGFLLGMSSLMAVAFEIPLTQRLTRFRLMRVVGVGTLLTALGLAANGLFLSWYWFLLMMVVWTLGEMTTISRLMAFAADHAPPEQRGNYLGSWQAVWRIANALSPVIFLPLFELASLRMVGAVLAVAAIPAILIFIYLDFKTGGASSHEA